MSDSPQLKGRREPTSTLPITTKCIPGHSVNGYAETGSSPRNDGMNTQACLNKATLSGRVCQAGPEDCANLQFHCCVPNIIAEALSGQKPANRSFSSLVASGFPWGVQSCQIGASIDSDQLAHACEELTAEYLCSALGEAMPLWEGTLGAFLC